MPARDAADYVAAFGRSLSGFKSLPQPDRERYLRLVRRFSADLEAMHERIREEEVAL